jgi:ParB-like chromosome segregation protein Spo0J
MHENTQPTSEGTSGPEVRAKLKPAQAVIDAFARGEIVDAPIHPAARLFPRLLKQELEELAEDIKKRGLEQPIVLHPDGSVLDGVHRLKACQLVGCKPRFAIWKGRPGEEIEFVVSTNLARRHLSDKQRSITAAKIARYERGRPKAADLPELTQREAAAALKVSERSTRMARKIVNDAPTNVQNLVEQDKLSLTAAEAVARASPDAKDRFSKMTDEEVVIAAKKLAKESDSARTSKRAPDLGQLIRRLHDFLGNWSKASDDNRRQLKKWLHEEPNALALEALKAMTTPLQSFAQAPEEN